MLSGDYIFKNNHIYSSFQTGLLGFVLRKTIILRVSGSMERILPLPETQEERNKGEMQSEGTLAKGPRKRATE